MLMGGVIGNISGLDPEVSGPNPGPSTMLPSSKVGRLIFNQQGVSSSLAGSTKLRARSLKVKQRFLKPESVSPILTEPTKL